MIQLKDYLHYYMGATFWTHNSEGEVNPETLRFIYPMIEKGKCFQLHLRRLEDMTEEEKNKLVDLLNNSYSRVQVGEYYAPQSTLPYKAAYPNRTLMSFVLEIDRLNKNQFHYFLSKHFDLFGLIDAGLAVDVKIIQP